MAKIKTRGFFARRKDFTVQVERTVKTKTQVLDKKGRPVIKNGKPEYQVTEQTIKENPITTFVIKVNNAVPPSHRMLC